LGCQMETFTQLEEISPYQHIDPYTKDSGEVEAVALASLLLGLLVGFAMWEWIMWRLPAKAGYRGLARWGWFFLLGFPLTTGVSLLAFMLFPWPVNRELEKTQARLDELRRWKKTQPTGVIGGDIDFELEQLKSNLN
jgi:hypothetical protein